MPSFMPEFFVKGGPVMWPLLLCSVVSVTVIVERMLFWWREARRRDDALIETLLERTEKGDCQSALQTGRGKGDAAARVLVAGLIHREHGLVEGMEVAAGEEIDRMKRGMGILDTIITMAPMLGILGTVTGIIKSFDLLGGGGVETPRAVTGGIAEALITTAAGLVVSLVTLVPYNYLLARVQRATRRLEQRATQFEVAYRRGTRNAPADGV